MGGGLHPAPVRGRRPRTWPRPSDPTRRPRQANGTRANQETKQGAKPWGGGVRLGRRVIAPCVAWATFRGRRPRKWQ
jgi:hypothetical protein